MLFFISTLLFHLYPGPHTIKPKQERYIKYQQAFLFHYEEITRIDTMHIASLFLGLDTHSQSILLNRLTTKKVAAIQLLPVLLQSGKLNQKQLKICITTCKKFDITLTPEQKNRK